MAKKTFVEVVLLARTGLNPRDNFKLGNGKNKYITIKNIHNNEIIIDENTDVVDDKALELIHKRSQIKKGDILFCSIGRMGDMYIIPDDPEGWDINESVFAFTVDTSLVRQKYFYYVFKNRDTIEYLSKNSSGSTFKSIKMNQLKKMVFDLPSLEEQDTIVSVLDRLSSAIQMREQELACLDNLIKARFVELFGEFKINDKGWKIAEFTDCASIDTNMIHDFAGYENYPHIGIDSIEKDTGRLVGYRTIAEDGVISGKYLFTPNHLIYSKIRPNLNKVAMPDFEGLCSADAYPILVKNGVCTREFFCYVLRSQFFLDYIMAFSNRTNLPKVNKNQVEGFCLPLPDYSVQMDFSKFVKQVDKSKVIERLFEDIFLTLRSRSIARRLVQSKVVA